MTELWSRSACALAGGIARKDFSCVEVIEAHLRRIEAVNPAVNAVVKVFAEEARRDAIEADRKAAAGEGLGPLHGVPFTIKDNIDVAGCATTWGVPAFADAVAPLGRAGRRTDAASRRDPDRPHQPARHGPAHAYRQLPATA